MQHRTHTKKKKKKTKCVTNGGANFRDLAPGQHSSVETWQRWRAAGDTVSDVTSSVIEPKNHHNDNVILNHCAKNISYLGLQRNTQPFNRNHVEGYNKTNERLARFQGLFCSSYDKVLCYQLENIRYAKTLQYCGPASALRRSAFGPRSASPVAIA